MKKIVSFFLIVAVLSFWIPCASAEEIGQYLDPMISPDVQATVREEASADSVTAGKASHAVSPADATASDKKAEGKKTKEKKKEKSKKGSKKKSSETKKKGSSSKSSKKQSKSAH